MILDILSTIENYHIYMHCIYLYNHSIGFYHINCTLGEITHVIAVSGLHCCVGGFNIGTFFTCPNISSIGFVLCILSL